MEVQKVKNGTALSPNDSTSGYIYLKKNPNLKEYVRYLQ